MRHSPLAEWKHALAKQCGLDLVFPCIIVKMFVSAIVSLLLLGTAALPCLLIVEGRVSPLLYQFTSRAIKAGPSSRRFMSTHCSVPGLLLPRRKQKAQRSKNSSKINIAKRKRSLAPSTGSSSDSGPRTNLRQKSSSQVQLSGSLAPLDMNILWARSGAGSLLLVKRMFNISLEFLKWKDVTLSVLDSAPCLTEVSFHIQLFASHGAPRGSPGESQRWCCARPAHPAWLRPAPHR